MTVIHCQNLSKTFRSRIKPEGLAASLRAFWAPSYRTVEAVREVSFQVGEGEILAFLGPNGAGKSTTIKMLCGLLHPTGGRASVLGYDPRKQRQALNFLIGSVFGQKSQLWNHLPPADSFRLLGAIYEIEPAVFRRRRDELSELFELKDLLDVPVRRLSLGQRIRCEIAGSLLHRPRLLFLDEPTIGLDVVVKQQIRALLLRLNREERTTIFLTSHDIGDIEKICRRAIIIHHGTLVVDESVKVLKHQAQTKKIIGVKYTHPVTALEGGPLPVKVASDALKYEIDTRTDSLQAMVRRLVDLGEVADLTVEDEPLENLIAEIFKSLTKEAINEKIRAQNP